MENASAIFQVLTFFAFGAVIVSTGYTGSVPASGHLRPLGARAGEAAAILIAFIGSGVPSSQRWFIAWFGPKGVASMLFALLVLGSQARTAHSPSTSPRS